MLTQKQIKQWIPLGIEIFQKYIPISIPLPQIYIGSPKKIRSLRTRLVKQTQSRQTVPPDPYDPIMEMIHGDAGDAILIQQELVWEGDTGSRDTYDPYDSDEPDNRAVWTFWHVLWHEFGHFFAIHYESDDLDEHGVSALYKYNDLELPDDGPTQYPNDNPKQYGYWFWSEFIAEAIANYVEEQLCRIELADYYHPESLTWEPDEWGCYPEMLQNFLEMGICRNDAAIDVVNVAMYFTTLLTRDFVKRYVKAAEDGKLKVWDNKSGRSVAAKPGSIDPTCISGVNMAFQEILWEIKAILDEQVAKKESWKIDEDFLDELGDKLMELREEKEIALLLGENG